MQEEDTAVKCVRQWWWGGGVVPRGFTVVIQIGLVQNVRQYWGGGVSRGASRTWGSLPDHSEII